MNLLLVEDEAFLAQALCRILADSGFTVDWAADGKVGLKLAQEGAYDLLLLDVGLPYKNGFHLLKTLRKEGQTLPIIMLTAKNDLGDRIMGLDSGADDYMAKPFNTNELLARIRANLRKKGETIGAQVKYGDIILEKEGLTLCCGDNSVKLTQKETELFDYFVKNNSAVIPAEKITEALGTNQENPVGISKYIGILSNKLRHISSTVAIIHINGIGYKLLSPTETTPWTGGR